MRDHVRRLFVLSVPLLLSACLGGPTWIPRFDYRVEPIRAADTPTFASPLRVSETSHEEAVGDFHNQIVGFTIGVEAGILRVAIHNRSASPISFLAAGATHVTSSGRTSSLRDPSHDPMSDQEIPAGSVAELQLRPESNTQYDSLQDPGTSLVGRRSTAKRAGEENMGRSFEIELPIRAEGSLHPYRFRFTVTGYRVRLTSFA